jgi:ESS family glutamate:Na+ symporter
MISLFSWLCEISGVAILIETVKPLLWGFNFVFAAVSAIFIRKLLGGLKSKGVIKQTYTNNTLLDRVAGVLFDMMVVSSIAAISIASFREPSIIIPLVVLCTVVAFVSYFYIHYVTSRLFPAYPEEAFLGCFGMLVGMASTGVILVREIDPYFKTPACKNLIYHAPYSVMMGFPILLLMGFAPQPGWMFPTLGIVAVMFTGFFIWIRISINKVQREHNG